MLPTQDLFVYVYVLVYDAIAAGEYRHSGPVWSRARLQ